MLLREVKYYFMTTNQLQKEVMRLRSKLESEEVFDIKLEYLEALADIIKTLVRRYKHDEEFMRTVRIELRKLQRQAHQAYEEVTES